MAGFVCSKCGGSDVKPLESRPSLDDRFAVGYCEACTPVPVFDAVKKVTRPLNRATVSLVRATHWTPDVIAERHRRKREQKLVADVMAGKIKSDDKRYDEAMGLLRRWEEEAVARQSA